MCKPIYDLEIPNEPIIGIPSIISSEDIPLRTSERIRHPPMYFTQADKVFTMVPDEEVIDSLFCRKSCRLNAMG